MKIKNTKVSWAIGILLFLIAHNSASVAVTNADGFANAKITKILIYKKKKRLIAYYKNNNIEASRDYAISLGGNDVGKKMQQNDNKTPEGNYKIIAKNSNSFYYKALKISYPNAEDLANSKKLNLNPGGDIMIHGIKNGLAWLGPLHLLINWTRGCVALTNADIDELYEHTELGTLVYIYP